jgi:hypothetical protein
VDELLQRETSTPWIPHDAATVFWRYPESSQPFNPPKRERRDRKGETYKTLGSTYWALWLPIGRLESLPFSSTALTTKYIIIKASGSADVTTPRAPFICVQLERICITPSKLRKPATDYELIIEVCSFLGEFD